MPSFEYEPLVIFPKPETLNEEEDRRDIDGARLSNTKGIERLGDLKGGKDNLQREVLQQTLQQVEFVLKEVSSREYAFVALQK